MNRMLAHFLALLRSGQLRFRLETFGLYHPATPDTRPSWKVSPASVLLLLRSGREYAAWIRTTGFVREGGAHEWWGRQWPGIDVEGELARLYTEKAEP
jgi:hypothetical protein